MKPSTNPKRRDAPALQAGDIVIAVDPGIDRVAAAILEVPAGRNPILGDLCYGVKAYRDVVQFTTDANATDAERCAQIAGWFAGLVVRWRPAEVVVEVPAKDGAYFGRQKRQRTKGNLVAASEAKLNRAIGAITAASVMACLGGPQVRELSSALYKGHLTKKKSRHEYINALFRRLGLPALKGNEDTRDAAFIGIFYLSLEADR